MTSLDRILRPSSIAVIGASRDPAKRGHQVLKSLLDDGFRGRVHAVNHRCGEALGQPLLGSVEEIPGRPDLAYIATPAETVPDILERCAAIGVAGAVAPAVGFRLAGDL